MKDNYRNITLNLSKLPEIAKQAEKANKRLAQLLRKKQPEELDKVVHELHKKTFEQINCLHCANCCKTTSPIFYQKDIERLAKRFRIKPSQFIEQYLKLDEDSDHVLHSSPCPFLEDDNRCSVYEDRPTACKEYPHTNRKRFYQLLNLSIKNTFICPAVFEIMEKLRKRYN